MKLSKSQNNFGIAFSFASWWICILGATYIENSYKLVFFALFTLISILIHFFWVFKNNKSFWTFYLPMLFLGFLGDATLFKLGFFKGVGQLPLYLPFWLIAMWLVFPLNFGHAFEKILKKPIVAILFGAIGAPLAYRAGPSFGILELSEYALFAVSAFWITYMVIALALSKKILKV